MRYTKYDAFADWAAIVLFGFLFVAVDFSRSGLAWFALLEGLWTLCILKAAYGLVFRKHWKP